MKINFLIICSFTFLLNCHPLDPTDRTTEVPLGKDATDESLDTGDIEVNEVLISRRAPEKCDNARPVQTPSPDAIACKSDDDCNSGDNGRCVFKVRPDGGMRECTYDECFKDDDCGENQVCSCGQDRHHNESFGSRSDENKCVESNCLTDNDCGVHFCKPNPNMCPEGEGRVIGYYCTTEQDDCSVDSDCEDESMCVFSLTNTKWFCTSGCP